MARLLRDVARALADRSAVDWSAVVSRTRSDADSAMVEALRGIEALRGSPAAPSTAQAPEEAGPLHLTLVRLVLTVALAQVACIGAILLMALASYGGPRGRLPQIVLACAFASGSVFLATCAKRDRRTFYLSAWFACGASAFARHALTGLPVLEADEMLFALRSVVPEAFMPACVWQFAIAFPRVRRFTRFDLLARRATAGAWLLGCVLFAINLVGPYLALDLAGLAPLLNNHPDRAFWHVITLTVAPAIATIFTRARRAPAGERRKVARLAAAIAFGSAPFLGLIALSAVSPRLNRWLVTSSPSERLWLDAIVIASLTATPLLSAMAVIADRPFELRRTLAWAWRHAIGRAIVEFVAFAPLALFAAVLYDLRHLPVQQVIASTNAWLLTACAGAIALAPVVRKKLLRALDRRESHRAREHHQQLVRALERIRTARGTREMAVVLRQEIIAGTGATAVNVFLPDSAGSSVDPSARREPLPPDGALMAMLHASPGPVDITSSRGLQSLLPHVDRTWVVEQKVELLVPVKHRDDAIAAVVALGPKRGGVPFDDRDRWLITGIAAAAAAAWTPGDALACADGSDHPSQRTSRDEGEAAFECPGCGCVRDTLPMPCGCGAPPRLAGLPQRIGDHLLVKRRIGAGGMGVVYLARDMALDREVALKTLPTLTPGAVAQLQNEARAMALNHPSLATIFGLERWRRTPILVVEHFPDGTLADRLARGPLAMDDAVRLGVTLASALSYMHAQGQLHRDLKPSNIGMSVTGSAKLLDFGLASLVVRPRTAHDAPAHMTITPIGTLAYLPPEAADGAVASPALDLWALAVVVLECLTGTNPFARDLHAFTRDRVGTSHEDLLDECLRSIDASLRPFFRRALSRDEHHRFLHADDLHAVLERLSHPSQRLVRLTHT